MEVAEQVIKKYVVENYGDLISADKAVQDEKTGGWEARLSSVYPRLIDDAKSEDVIVRFLNLRDLGTVRLDKRLEVTGATTSKECESQLASRLDLWKKQAEMIVVSSSSDVFARIAESIHVLNPLKLVLEQLTKKKDVKVELLDVEIDEQGRPVRIRQYMDLLEELDIVRRTKSGYTYGNTFTGLAEATHYDNRQLKTSLISHVIKQKYSVLRQVFEITQLEPFVHLDNCYYWPALEAEKLVRSTRSNLYQRQLDYYDWMSTWDFDSKLGDLLDQGALEEENGYIKGNAGYFDTMLGMKHETLELNP